MIDPDGPDAGTLEWHRQQTDRRIQAEINFTNQQLDFVIAQFATWALHVDSDADGVINSEDPFPFDADDDGVPDKVDDYPTDNTRHDFGDRDGDGIRNGADPFPDIRAESHDSDGDRVPDYIDIDTPPTPICLVCDQNVDLYDPVPTDPGKPNDRDGDGIPDNIDRYPDTPSTQAGTNTCALCGSAPLDHHGNPQYGPINPNDHDGGGTLQGNTTETGRQVEIEICGSSCPGGEFETTKQAPTHDNRGRPYCVSASSDSDNDGWGWENNRSCVVR